MVNFVKRDKNDIFSIPLLHIIFKNRIFQRIIQIIVLFLFVYAIYFGFIKPTKEELAENKKILKHAQKLAKNKKIIRLPQGVCYEFEKMKTKKLR